MSKFIKWQKISGHGRKPSEGFRKNGSSYERRVFAILSGLNCNFENEFTPSKEICKTQFDEDISCRYDFVIHFSNIDVFIEVDGEQHFKTCKKFDRGLDSYSIRQEKDIAKTKLVLSQKASIIRLHHNCDMETILPELIKKAQVKSDLYLHDSYRKEYQWLTTRLNNSSFWDNLMWIGILAAAGVYVFGPNILSLGG